MSLPLLLDVTLRLWPAIPTDLQRDRRPRTAEVGGWGDRHHRCVPAARVAMPSPETWWVRHPPVRELPARARLRGRTQFHPSIRTSRSSRPGSPRRPGSGARSTARTRPPASSAAPRRDRRRLIRAGTTSGRHQRSSLSVKCTATSVTSEALRRRTGPTPYRRGESQLSLCLQGFSRWP